MLSAPFNLLWDSGFFLSVIFSFSSNTMPFSCLLSSQNHCISPLIEFWSSLFFWLLSNVLCCLTAFTCASHCQFFLYVLMVIFSQASVTFPLAWYNVLYGFQSLFSMWVWTVCVKDLPTSLHLTFATHCWLFFRRSFLSTHFDLRSFLGSLIWNVLLVALSQDTHEDLILC